MSISGLIEKTARSVRNWVKRIFKRFAGLFRRGQAQEEASVEIPRKWVKPEMEPNVKSGKGVLTIKKGKVVVSPKKLYHWPWIRNLKRLLAGFLLLVNFAFSQILMVSRSTLQIGSVFFFLNCFILLDYLWKTRRDV